MWRPSGEWRNAPELSVKLVRIKATETTWNLLRNFKRHGQISYIEIFEEDSRGERRAKVKFSPPPSSEFWGNRLYQMEAVDGSQYNITVVLWDDQNKTPRSFLVQSPIKPHVFYEPKIALWPSSLHVGIMVDPNSMMPLQNITPDVPADLKFTVDLVRKKITAECKITFRDPRSQGATGFVGESEVGEFDRKNHYMFQIPFDQLKTISQFEFPDKRRFALAISLESPPQYHRKREDEQSSHSDENPTWSEWDTWYRQTDIVYDPYRLQTAVIALHKEKPVIDIGICPFLLPSS
jgi:RNA-dependent RNA polymerase